MVGRFPPLFPSAHGEDERVLTLVGNCELANSDNGVGVGGRPSEGCSAAFGGGGCSAKGGNGTAVCKRRCVTNRRA